MIKIKMSKLNAFKNEQFEDDLCRKGITPIIDFVKNHVIISPPFAFRGEHYKVVVITEHDLLKDFSIGEIKSLTRGLDGESTLIILFAYINEADYPYPNIPDEDSYPEKTMKNQAKVFENHGFVRAKCDYNNRYLVPYIYTNEFGSEILEWLDREFFPCITPEPFNITNDGIEDYIRNSYITITKSNMTMLCSFEPSIRTLVNKMMDNVVANVSCLSITMQDKVYLFNNELLQFSRAWDNFKENTKNLDDSDVQLFSIGSDIIAAGYKLSEAYKATCSRLTNNDFELVENFRDELQTYVIEHVEK